MNYIKKINILLLITILFTNTLPISVIAETIDKEEKHSVEVVEDEVKPSSTFTASALSSQTMTTNSNVDLTDFYIPDNKVITGTGPFDTKDIDGQDSSEDNDVVRSFDSITYNVYFDLLLNPSEKDATIKITSTYDKAWYKLPSGQTRESARFQNDTLSTSDSQGTRISTRTDTLTLNSSGTYSIPITLEVKGALQNEEIKPSFKIEVISTTNASTNVTSTVSNVSKTTEPKKVKVSAKEVMRFKSASGNATMLAASDVLSGNDSDAFSNVQSVYFYLPRLSTVDSSVTRGKNDYRGVTFPSEDLKVNIDFKITANGKTLTQGTDVDYSNILQYGLIATGKNLSTQANNWQKNPLFKEPANSTSLSIVIDAYGSTSYSQGHRQYSYGSGALSAVLPNNGSATFTLNNTFMVSNAISAKLSSPTKEDNVYPYASFFYRTYLPNGNGNATTTYTTSTSYSGNLNSWQDSLTVNSPSASNVGGGISQRSLSLGEDTMSGSNKNSSWIDDGRGVVAPGEVLRFILTGDASGIKLKNKKGFIYWNPQTYSYRNIASSTIGTSQTAPGIVLGNTYGVLKAGQEVDYAKDNYLSAYNKFNWYTSEAQAKAAGTISAVLQDTEKTGPGESFKTRLHVDVGTTDDNPNSNYSSNGSRNYVGIYQMSTDTNGTNPKYAGAVALGPATYDSKRAFVSGVANSGKLVTSFFKTNYTIQTKGSKLSSPTFLSNSTTTLESNPLFYYNKNTSDTEITVDYKVVIPSGLEYVQGTTMQNGKNMGEPNVRTNSDGTKTLLWQFPINSIVSNKLVTFKLQPDSTKIEYNSANKYDYTINSKWSIQYKENGTMYEDSTIQANKTTTVTGTVNKLSQLTPFLRNDTPLIEIGHNDNSLDKLTTNEVGNGYAKLVSAKNPDTLRFAIGVKNDTSTPVNNYRQLITFPTNATNQNTTYSGEYTVSGLDYIENINTNEVKNRMTFYIAKKDLNLNENTDPNSIQINDTDWVKVKIRDGLIFTATKGTAILMEMTTVEPQETALLGFRITLNRTPLLKTDTIELNSTMNSDLNVLTKTNPISTSVRSRSISGEVFIDKNMNGVKDPGEGTTDILTATLNRTSIWLPSFNEVLTENMTKNALPQRVNGTFLFDNLPEGNYSIKFNSTNTDKYFDYQFTKKDSKIASQEANTSKVNSNGLTDLYSLDLKESSAFINNQLNVSNVNVGIVFKRFVTIRLKDELGKAIPESTFSIYDSKGNKVYSGITDSKGEYITDGGLAPGNYTIVQESIPFGSLPNETNQAYPLVLTDGSRSDMIEIDLMNKNVSGATLNVQGNGEDEKGEDPKNIYIEKTTIEADLEPLKIKSIATVTDYTGGNGWTLSAKIDNYNETKDTVVQKLSINGDKPKYLTSEDVVYASGDWAMDPIDLDGTVIPEWGVAPKLGKFSQQVTWTLTANINDKDAK